MELCTQQEMCEDGEGGDCVDGPGAHSDGWTAVSNIPNEWLKCVSTTPADPDSCKLYTTKNPAMGMPTWGESPSSTEPFGQSAQCCRKKSVTTAGGRVAGFFSTPVVGDSVVFESWPLASSDECRIDWEKLYYKAGPLDSAVAKMNVDQDEFESAVTYNAPDYVIDLENQNVYACFTTIMFWGGWSRPVLGGRWEQDGEVADLWQGSWVRCCWRGSTLG